MRLRPFGTTGTTTSVLGYGSMALSLEAKPEAEALAVVEKVLHSGVTFFDTADTYCRSPGELHHNEKLLARALEPFLGDQGVVIIATKGGTVRTERGWEIDGSPDFLYRSICGSYEALGGRRPIPLWQHHWPDPRHSITEMMRVVARAVEEKLVRYVGVGNYTLEQLREARDVVEVVSIQNQYNFWHRDPERDGMLEYCEREGLVFLPWRPMGGLGLAQRLGEIKPLAEMASRHGVSPQCLTLAWHMARSGCILPIPGSGRWENIRESLEATRVRLEAEDMAILNGLGEADLPVRERPAAWRRMPPLTHRENGS